MSTRRRVFNRPVLVLNATFEPIHIADTRRALKLIVKGVAVAEKEHEDFEIRKGLFAPLVVRLLEYRRVPHIKVHAKSKMIHMRDEFTCQYCGTKLPGKDLTLDHIIPKAHGGKDAWENLVTCCGLCNGLKGDRFLTEGIRYPMDFPVVELRGQVMHLPRRPRAVNMHTSRSMLRIMGGHDPAWREYLYY